MSAPALPASFDLNAETYPFAAVEQELDRAAIFNLYCTPGRGQTRPPLCASGDEFHFHRSLRRFLVATQNPSVSGLTAWSGAGEVIATSEQRWVMIPKDEVGHPGEPPRRTVRFDASEPQRFLLTESNFSFGGGGSFRGFGAGSTFPNSNSGDRTPACAVGTIMSGEGLFSGLQGTYTWVGTLSAEEGFTGNVLLRVVDPRSRLQARTPLPSFSPVMRSEPDVTYLVLRGQKKDRTQKSRQILDSAGNSAGLDVSQQLRLFDVDCALTPGEVGCRMRLRQAIGSMNAKIAFNLSHPGGPGDDSAPIPFTSYNRYEFELPGGGSLGSFEADSLEGRTFFLRLDGLPRQAALRFGGFGPLRNGTGCFKGLRGLMTDNSVVGLAPHALSTLYVLRIEDPEGRYRSSENAVWW